MAQILAGDTDADTGDCPGAADGAAASTATRSTCPRPSYPGPMHFILTTRDGLGGRTDSDQVQVNLAPGTGPFLVTAPNTAVSYPGGDKLKVTWDVAGTDVAPIGTSKVEILLSTDGGQTFSTVLAETTKNDGSQSVTLPDVATTQARIEIQRCRQHLLRRVRHQLHDHGVEPRGRVREDPAPSPSQPARSSLCAARSCPCARSRSARPREAGPPGRCSASSMKASSASRLSRSETSAHSRQ